MAGVNKSDIPAEAKFFTDFWPFVKRFYLTEEDDGYWRELIDATDNLYRQCGTELSRKLLLAYCDYLDEKHRAGASQVLDWKGAEHNGGVQDKDG